MLAESILSKNTTILMYIYILNLLLLLFHVLLRHSSKCALKGFKETTELRMPPTKHFEYKPLKKWDKGKGHMLGLEIYKKYKQVWHLRTFNFEAISLCGSDGKLPLHSNPGILVRFWTIVIDGMSG